jgi:hypothetical protein
MPDHTPKRTSLPLLIVAAAGFALAYTQSPLFFSNQNQYLLHGLADAGYGHLDRDWLANTKDPTPAFSFMVQVLFRIGGPFALQAAFFILLMGYFLAMWRLASSLASVRLLPFAALFTAAHAAIFRLASVRLTGTDYPWYLQAGVAGQYLLGPGLQPSAFGVLLAASLAAFARGRPHRAAVFAALAADVHATYLLPAALLTFGYAIGLLRNGQRRTAIGVSAVSLAVVAPMLAYVLSTFPPNSSEQYLQAQHVLATVRIPHHAQIARWLDGVAIVQLAWAGLGIILLRGTNLFVPSLAAIGGAMVLTLVQAATGSDSLALLFPWRISALLVPVATAVICVKLARFDSGSRLATPLALFLFALLVAGGIAVMALGLGYQMNDAEEPLLQFVRAHASQDDVYLIPTRIPPVGTGSRGVISTSFTPPPRPKPGSNLIPVDLQRFRLATGAAIYVDFKSVPYASAEVLEWLRRVEHVEKWYGDADWGRLGRRDQLVKEGISHVVLPTQHAFEMSFLERIYEDGAYAVYRVR